MRIQVIDTKLSDGSTAWNIKIVEPDIPAISFKDAMLMADKIRDAVNKHSVKQADID